MDQESNAGDPVTTEGSLQSLCQLLKDKLNLRLRVKPDMTEPLSAHTDTTHTQQGASHVKPGADTQQKLTNQQQDQHAELEVVSLIGNF